MRYMLDTNICIYLIKRHPPQVVRRLEALTQGSTVMSVVTYAELRAGLEMQTSNREQDERVLNVLTQRIPKVTGCSGLRCRGAAATPWTA